MGINNIFMYANRDSEFVSFSAIFSLRGDSIDSCCSVMGTELK